MTAHAQKLKTLHLARLFYERTDEGHGLTMPEIIEALEELGVSAERKAIYRDIDTLRAFGMNIAKIPGRPVSYALTNREFSEAELTLLVDAVQNSRFLTTTKSNQLVKSLKKLGSAHQAAGLSKNVHVEGRIKSQNESVYRIVDVVQEAIRLKRKIDFCYFSYNVEKQRVLRRDGKRYRVTPVALIYSEGFYYLVAYDDKYADFTNYRVDRMTALKISDEPSTRNAAIAAFDVNAYQSRSFSMYRGAKRNATLLVKESVMDSVIDRFGKDVFVSPAAPPAGAAKDERWTRVSVSVMESPPFFGWLAQFGGGIVLEAPSELAKAYARHLETTLAAQRKHACIDADVPRTAYGKDDQ